jgi:hypothetical protein
MARACILELLVEGVSTGRQGEMGRAGDGDAGVRTAPPLRRCVSSNTTCTSALSPS